MWMLVSQTAHCCCWPPQHLRLLWRGLWRGSQTGSLRCLRQLHLHQLMGLKGWTLWMLACQLAPTASEALLMP